MVTAQLSLDKKKKIWPCLVVLRQGFTLIEMLIVVAILATVLSIGLPVASRYQIDSQINETTSLLIENLRLAAQDSQSGWKDAGYGLKFLPNQYVIYQGDNYASRQVNFDRVVPLLSSLKIELSISPLLDEIPFNRRGLAQSNGTITITHQSGSSKSLIINNLGTITLP